jgi:uncharacterized protein
VSFDLPQSGLIALPRPALAALRAVLFRQDATNAASYLFESGYAGGAALHDAFTRWCASRQLPVPEDMSAPDFQTHVTAFFSELGLGELRVGTLHDTALTFDSENWGEADPGSAMPFPACYLTAGLFTDFFGRIGGSTVSVMEVECRSTGAARCRFLVASAETIQQVYDGITQGGHYETVLQQVG